MCLERALHVLICFTSSFLVKLACKFYNLLRFVFMLETSGYDFPRGPQEGPKGCRDTALAVLID